MCSVEFVQVVVYLYHAHQVLLFFDVAYHYLLLSSLVIIPHQFFLILASLSCGSSVKLFGLLVGKLNRGRNHFK